MLPVGICVASGRGKVASCALPGVARVRAPAPAAAARGAPGIGSGCSRRPPRTAATGTLRTMPFTRARAYLKQYLYHLMRYYYKHLY